MQLKSSSDKSSEALQQGWECQTVTAVRRKTDEEIGELQHKLSREEESEATDAEVTKEDQDKINEFSRLHNRSKFLEDELALRQKDKEDLSDVTMELELADESEKIPYRVGDSFFQVSLGQAQKMLEKDTEEIEGDVERIEEELSGLKDEIGKLKAHLYARFGKGINLEA